MINIIDKRTKTEMLFCELKDSSPFKRVAPLNIYIKLQKFISYSGVPSQEYNSYCINKDNFVFILPEDPVELVDLNIEIINPK